MAIYENVDGVIKQVAGEGVTGTDGILVEGDVVKLNANFNVKSTPLGDESSKLSIYSDGKIGVDFTESPVILTTELLAEGQCPDGSNIIASLNIPNMKDYDMYLFDLCAKTGSSYTSMITNVIPKGSDNMIIQLSNSLPGNIQPGTTAPTDIIFLQCKSVINFTNGTMTNFSSWMKPGGLTGSWSAWGSTASGQKSVIRIYGIKAR